MIVNRPNFVIWLEDFLAILLMFGSNLWNSFSKKKIIIIIIIEPFATYIMQLVVLEKIA